jgi:hypothetical protein
MQEEQKDFILEGIIPDEATEMKILGIEEFGQAEWVFQFDGDEPIVIAWSNDASEAGELSFVLKPNSGSNITFQSQDGKKTLRIFSREMSDETRNRRDSQYRHNNESDNSTEISE